MTDLDKLIEAIEGGAGFSGLQVGSFDNHCAENIVDAYHGSLDAAKALHEALTPNYLYTISKRGNDVTVFCGIDAWGISPIAARAWLLSILKAYRSLK